MLFYQIKKTGSFKMPGEHKDEPKSVNVIGETHDMYVIGIKEVLKSDEPNFYPYCSIVGIDKNRLICWMCQQLELF